MIGEGEHAELSLENWGVSYPAVEGLEGSRQLMLMLPMTPRCTAVSTSVVTQQQLSEPSAEAPRARPCRVTTADRSVRKGIMAHSLEDLHVKVGTGLPPHSSPWGPWLRGGSW